jgi:hypothetical protein
VRPVYLLLDTSGSTGRAGFADGRDQAMPLVVDQAARLGGLAVAVLIYGTRADTLVWLSDPADIKLIPAVRPGGLSSLAAGLRLLADSVRSDTARLAADGVDCLPPVALVVADGLPTDGAGALLDARAELATALTDAGATAPPLFAAPAATDRLAVAGLRMEFHPLDSTTPVTLAWSVLGAFGRLLAGCAA